MLRLTPALLLLTLLGAACDSGPTEPEPERITLRGPVVNRLGIEIPAGARALIAWTVTTTTPDYVYIWGEGRLYNDGTSFQIDLDGPPPAATLNAGETGVGLIFLTTNEDVGVGSSPVEIPSSQILGLAGQYGVIYRASSTNSGGPAWIDDFPVGYAVGVGVETSGTFDDFAASDADGIELIVDALGNIDVVNWTSRLPAAAPRLPL